MLRLRVEAGLHFLRMLEQQPLSQNYRRAFIARFALQRAADAEACRRSRRPTRALRRRRWSAVRRMRAVLRACCAAAARAPLRANPALKIVAADRAEVQQTATRWLAWYDTLFSEPGWRADDAWMPAAHGVRADRSPGSCRERPVDERPLTASEFYDGHLDWSSFDLDFEVNLGTERDRKLRRDHGDDDARAGRRSAARRRRASGSSRMRASSTA